MGNNISNGDNSVIINRSSIDNSFNTNNSSDAVSIVKELATQVENILKELERRNPSATEKQQINYIDAVIETGLIQRCLGLSRNVVNTCIEEFILDNQLYKYSKVLNAALAGWQNGLS